VVLSGNGVQWYVLLRNMLQEQLLYLNENLMTCRPSTVLKPKSFEENMKEKIELHKICIML
jgi:hypothetical protein